LWSKKLPFVLDGFSRATITKDGEIVFPVAIGQNTEAGVAKFSSRGDLIWRIELSQGGYICSEIVSDIDGNIYCSTTLGPMYVISSVGEIVAQVGSRMVAGMSPAIFPGCLIFGDQYGGVVYAVK
jgi:hypothetical protein